MTNKDAYTETSNNSAYKRTMERLLSDGSFFALIGNVDIDRHGVKLYVCYAFLKEEYFS